MFTGIITDTTRVIDSQKKGSGLRLLFEKRPTWTGLDIGESICTDGVCLTVASIDDNTYTCHLMAETLAITTFGYEIPATVNLERSLQVHDRFGGHFVQGHVDGVGTVTSLDESDGYRLVIKFDAHDRALVIHKGSITINGVSLTVSAAADDTLEVALIPHTLQHTTLGTLKVHDMVNLEFDMIGKYIVRTLEAREDYATRRTS